MNENYDKEISKALEIAKSKIDEAIEHHNFMIKNGYRDSADYIALAQPLGIAAFHINGVWKGICETIIAETYDNKERCPDGKS